ncbi:hypothetical protein CBS147346_10788 [Aspergillus niger]|nr:hypothetical protein CBS147346_10788 [Aspergillus niger]
MDPASLGLGALSLSFQVFAGCVKGFSILSAASCFGKDASFIQTMLNVEEYRFVLWADIVGLTSQDCKILPQINMALAEVLMIQLKEKLDDGKLKQNYNLELNSTPSPSPSPSTKTHSSNVDAKSDRSRGILAKAISDERRAEILERAKIIQGQNNLPRRLWWAVQDRSKFQNLVRDLRDIVNSLWSLVEPVRQLELSQQVERTLSLAIRISNDIEGLKGLQASFQGQTSLRPNEAVLFNAAHLKAVREELQDDEDNPHGAPKSVCQEPLPKLSLSRTAELQPHLLKIGANRSASETIVPAVYDGKPVLAESKRVHPRMKAKLKIRAENLSKLLSLPKSEFFSTLHCIGFLEASEEFIFLYDYPPGTDTGVPPQSLQGLLRDSKMKPLSVTSRLELALAICRTVLTVHTAGWLHKNIRSENIIFFGNTESSGDADAANLKSPYLAGFTFSRTNSAVEISDQVSEHPLRDIYRHPHSLGQSCMPFAMYMDLYSLGMVLVEIAEWRPLKHTIKKHVDVTNSVVDIQLQQLIGIQDWLLREQINSGRIGFRMGDVFEKGVYSLMEPRALEDRDQEEGSEDLLLFQQFVNALIQCRV